MLTALALLAFVYLVVSGIRARPGRHVRPQGTLAYQLGRLTIQPDYSNVIRLDTYRVGKRSKGA